MPRNQRFPHARPPRRAYARFALVGAAAAFGALLVVPVIGPQGISLDLKGVGAVPNVIAQGPSLVALRPSPASADSAPTASPRPSATPSAVPSPSSVAPTPTRDTAGANGLGYDPIVFRAPAIESLTGYRWPVAKVRLTLPFGPTVWGSRLVDGEPFHDGIDLATFCGDRVTAAHDGVVLAAGRHYDAYMGWVGDLGPYLRRLDAKNLWMTLPIVVVVADGNGYRSMYAHFGRIVVRPGQVVKAGQLLGYEGATGRASGCHVHYGLFSPLETANFAIEPDVAKRMKLPKAEIARIDPLLILPPEAGVNAPRVPEPSQGQAGSPSPSPVPAR